ncbi:peptidase S24 [Acidovorax sp. LjRoot38]|uniref:LexA family protein n=1 Tax=Acidovorax sp. LjRoot38 TaxID=3342327 RepID=UPI003ECE84D1
MARTNRDAMHLRSLRELYRSEGCFPSYSRIASHLGFKAKNAAFKLIDRLVSSGHLVKSAGGRVAPSELFFTLDLSADEVRAGFGADMEASGLVQAQALDQILATKPSKTVFVKLRGDSMVDAGILSGDIAAVEVAHKALPGEFVIAEADGHVTVKEFQVVAGRPRLVPHNASMEALDPQRSLNIIGVVRGIVRTFRPPPAGKVKLTTWGVAI